MKLLTLTQAAKRLKLSRQRVHVLIRAGRIKAVRVGHAWLVADTDCKVRPAQSK